MADQNLTIKILIDGNEAAAVLDSTKGQFIEIGEAAEQANEQIKSSYKDLTGEISKLNQTAEGTGINKMQSPFSLLSDEINNARTFMDNFNTGNKAFSENLPETVQLINKTEMKVDGFYSKIKINEAGFGAFFVILGRIAAGLGILDFVLEHILPLFKDTTDSAKDQREEINRLSDAWEKLTSTQIKNKLDDLRKDLQEFEKKHPVQTEWAFNLERVKGGLSPVYKTEVSTEERFGEDAETVENLKEKISLLERELLYQGELDDANIRLGANQKKLGNLNEKNFSIIVSGAKSLEEAGATLDKWMEADKKIIGISDERSSTGGQKENLFDKRKEELLDAQRHAELLLKLDSDNNGLMLLLKIKHFDEMIALYKKFGLDTVNLVKQRGEAEEELTSNISPRGIEKGEKKKMEMYRITEKFHADHQKKLQKAAELTTEDKLNLLSQERGAVADSLGQVSGLFAKHTLAYQAFAKAQALIDTYTAAEAAYKAVVGIPFVGPALAVAAAIAATVAGLARVEQIGKVEIPKGGGFQEGGRLPKGKMGYFEGTSNEIVAPESDFKTYSAELVRHALIDSRNYINITAGGSSSGELIAIKQELISLREDFKSGSINARAYLDDREAKKIVMRGGAMNRRSKI